MKFIQASLYFGALLICSSLVTSSMAAPSRVWTNSQGKKINARLLQTDFDNATVELERSDGACFTLPISQLSQDDQQFLQDRPDKAVVPVPPPLPPNEAPVELTDAHWAWLQQAAKIEPQNYADVPLTEIAKVLNQNLIDVKTPNTKTAIIGVRVAPKYERIKVSGEFSKPVDLGNYLKSMAYANNLKIQLYSNNVIVLEKNSESDEVKFLGVSTSRTADALRLKP